MQYAYDAAGNVLKQAILGADGECLESSTRYDLKDRATHRTNPAGGVTRYLYDRNDRLRKEINPYGYEPESDDGAGVSYTYDSRGNRLRTTNALGGVVQGFPTTCGISRLSKRIRLETGQSFPTNWTERSRISGDQGTIRRTLQQYEYNAGGQITGVVDGNQNPISYDVDSWGRITGIGFVDGGRKAMNTPPRRAGQRDYRRQRQCSAVPLQQSRARSARELTSWAIQRPSGMTRRATCPCISTGMEDSCSAPATYSDSLCMRRRPMQRENIPTSAHGTMTAWDG